MATQRALPVCNPGKGRLGVYEVTAQIDQVGELGKLASIALRGRSAQAGATNGENSRTVTSGRVARRGARWLTVAALLSCLLFLGCSETTQPSPIILAVAGTWTGAYRINSCTPAGILQACSPLTSKTYPMRLTLTQAGPAVNGTFDGVVADGSTVSIAISGTVDTSRSFSVAGNQPFQNVYRGAEWVGQVGVSLDQWTMTMPDSTSMVGGFRQTVQSLFSLTAYPMTIAFQSEIITLNRTAGLGG